MRCEIVAVGTELLLGQIIDTNSSWIASELALTGIDCHYQTRVGDNAARIAEVLTTALSRADAVIVCGGLGPTQDDITRDIIAQVMGVELVRDQAIADRIAQRFADRGRTMSANNLRQADVPQGASTIAQMPGTAPGLVCPIGDKVIYALPGVPYELKEMVTGTVLPDLQRRAGEASVIRSRVLRTWGHSESGLAELLNDRIEALDATGNPTLAFLASGIEGIKVRITAKADSAAVAERLIHDEEARIRAILGDLIFGVDDQTMESVILDRLRERGLTLAVAESVTGGMVATRLTAIPGASDVLRGALVAYNSAVKFEQLDVPQGPVVSEAAAVAMARGVQKRFGVDIGLATTGVAGPDELEGQPVGTVWLGWAIGAHAEAQRVMLPGRREQVRQFSVISLLNGLRLKLN